MANSSWQRQVAVVAADVFAAKDDDRFGVVDTQPGEEGELVEARERGILRAKVQEINSVKRVDAAQLVERLQVVGDSAVAIAVALVIVHLDKVHVLERLPARIEVSETVSDFNLNQI